MTTVRLTMAQGLVRYLCNSSPSWTGRECRFFPGVFAIFGHGNVSCLSEALQPVQDVLPTWRGQKRAVDGAGRDRLCKGQTRRADHGGPFLDRARAP
jgi:3D-(3,5/4)-trihydroxycyclohexane-1,2-dione acylhydrolase (decyclizing)